MILNLPLYINQNFDLSQVFEDNFFLGCDGLGGDFICCLDLLSHLGNFQVTGFLHDKAWSCHSLIFINCDVCYVKVSSHLYFHYPIFSPHVSSQDREKYRELYLKFYSLPFDLPEKGFSITARQLHEVNPDKFRLGLPSFAHLQ